MLAAIFIFTVLEAWRLAALFTSIRHKLPVILHVWHPSDESPMHIITPWNGYGPMLKWRHPLERDLNQDETSASMLSIHAIKNQIH